MPDENPPSTSVAASSSSAASKPAAAPPVSDPAAPAGGDPATAAEYASQPERVTAVQYTAPDGADEPGNLDEVAALGVEVTKQDPWDPAAGQNCILIGYPAEDGALPVRYLVQPGQYVAVRPDANAFEVYDAEQFEQVYSRTK